MAWFYLLLAAVFETAWTFSIKFLSFKNIKLLTFSNFYKIDQGLLTLAPLIGYIIFGLGNVYFFSLAIKKLSMATAYATWTATTIVLIKISEVSFLNGTISFKEIFFMLMMMTGLIGLKYYSTSV